MGDKTNAMRVLDSHKIAYHVHTYSPDIHSASEAAQALNLPAERVYKTLVVLRGTPRARPLLVMIPGDSELDLRALARASGDKKLHVAAHKEAEAMTGLRVGGIGALALLKRGFEMWIDHRAASQARILVSAGQRGINLELDVDDLLRVTGARPFVNGEQEQGDERRDSA